MELLDRFRGSFLGLAIGDAIGHPTEFISSVPRIRQKYGEKGVLGFEPSGAHKAGTFTDDTQMSIAVARALVRKGHAPLDELMKLMGDEFVAWADHPTNNRAPGGTCLAGCRKLKQGAAWRDAGVKESKGCGAAMRAAPVGLYCYDDDDALVRIAAAQSVLTHSHPTGIASSVAAAAPVAWVLRGNGVDGMIEFTKAMVSKVTPEMLRDLGAKESDIESIGVREQIEILDETAAAIASGDETEDVCQFLGGAWVGEEAVACALWCVLKAKGDFTESVLRGANSSGDSDSIACIAGSIAGALVGVAAIKSEWVDGVERSADLDALARALFAGKSSGNDTASLAGNLDFFDTEKPKAARTAVTSIADSTEDYGDPDDTPDEDDAVDDDDDEEPVGAASSTSLDESVGVTVEDLRAQRLPDLDGLSTEQLEIEVAKHNRLYWELAAPVISDVDFDRLCRALHTRTPDSHALKHLGARPDAFSAVKHREPMLSLDKCYEELDLVKWTKSLSCDDVLAMPKIDGLACSLRYDDDGELVVAATRGDGEEGEDITPNARAVANVPARIAREHAPLEVRGEVYMSLASFARRKLEIASGTSTSSSAGASASNPRNLAAGALRQKDPNATRRAELAFLAYDVRSTKLAESGRQRDKIDLVKQLGFATIDHVVINKDRAIEAVRELSAKRASLAYETDGVVIMADDVGAQKSMGATAHHPRWAIAWKFQGEEGTSVLRGVEWSVARTGTITPVALVEPVQLSGVTVARATLHHMGFVKKLGLHVGAKIAMVRRGGVIPHVERVIEAHADAAANAISAPATCPACGAAVVEDGDFVMCSKPDDCVAARVGRLLHFAEACDIQGLGDVIVDDAVQRGLVRTPADLFRATAAQLASLEKCGEKNAQKIIGEIAKAKSMPLDVLLRSLGIANLGKTAARALAERYGTLAKIRAAGAGEISQIKGFGDVIAQSIVDGLKGNGALIDDLLSFVSIEETSAASASGPLAGKSFVFTGKLSIDRKQAEAKVKSLGATVPSSVTKALTHLVLGGSERDGPSTKEKAARKLVAEGASLAIIDEAAFAAMLADVASKRAVTELPVTTLSAPTIVPEAAPSTTPTEAAPIEGAPSTTPIEAAPSTTPIEAEQPAPDPKKRQLTLF